MECPRQETAKSGHGFAQLRVIVIRLTFSCKHVQQFQRCTVRRRLQPFLRSIQFLVCRRIVARLDLFARMRKKGVADQSAHLRVDRVEFQYLFRQPNGLLKALPASETSTASSNTPASLGKRGSALSR